MIVHLAAKSGKATAAGHAPYCAILHGLPDVCTCGLVWWVAITGGREPICIAAGYYEHPLNPGAGACDGEGQ
jgi:hypothetical protein